MSDPVVKRFESTAELRAAARAWDDLWQRSEITLPTARAGLVALWCESFAAQRPFSAYVVEQNGQLVAALPLLEKRFLGRKIGLLPDNNWSPCGDLLLDPTADAGLILAELLRALRRDHWSLLWLDAVPIGASRWQAFLKALDQCQFERLDHQRCTINCVAIQHDWDLYFNSRSRNHRRHIRKSAALADQAGTFELACYDQLALTDVEPLLEKCFEIEASGWKGSSRTAVVNVPGLWNFYLQQARQLATWGQLNLNVLQHKNRSVAFEYGWRSKGVYFSPKVGYDESFRQCTPGQLLRARILERFHNTRGVEWLDFLGPASDATSKWATHQYAIDRLIVSFGGPLNRALLTAYRRSRSVLFNVRREQSPTGSRLAPPPSPAVVKPGSDDTSMEPLAESVER